MNTAAAVILLAAAAVGTGAQAQTQAPSPWHAIVAAPRSAFPTVTVDLGYRGPYVPTETSPITLRATAGDIPFDGYIGYHFQAGDRRTSDIPVIARAQLHPHQSWTFSTFVKLRHFAAIRGESPANTVFVPRELVIEWRSASMRVAARQHAGIPPWTSWRERLKPLRLSSGAISGATLGRDAYVEGPNALPDRAQWYAGFSDLVTPLDVWIDLPLRVREAILGSSIPVVFYGFPRATQQLDTLDRTLLPVTFDARPGSYQAPWPYGTSAAVASPRSWTAKSETYPIGSGPLPYMVRSSAATWVADEAGIHYALPAVRTTPIDMVVASRRDSTSNPDRLSHALPRPSQIARVHPAAALVIFAAIAAFAGWVLFRRRPRIVVALALVVMALSIVAARYRIRPRSGVYDVLIDHPVAPGIVGTLRAKLVYGPASLPAEKSDPERMRTSLTSAEAEFEYAELRTSDTAVSMGMMRRLQDWDSIIRWWKRSELGDSPTIHIRQRDGKTLVLDYEAPFSITNVHAQWLCGDRLCFGEADVSPSAHGQVTISDGRTLWEEDEPILWNAPRPAEWHRASTARVTLIHRDRESMRAFEWIEPAAKSRDSFLLTGRGTDSFAFALPVGITESATAFVDISNRAASPNVTLSWAGGSTTLTQTGRKGVAFDSRSYAVPPSALHDAVANGGIVNVATPAGAQLTTASIEVWEKKP